MTSHPAVLIKASVKHLFASPLIVSELPLDIANEINPRLEEMILEKSRKMPSSRASNRGGWQSDDQIAVWGGPDVETVIAAIRQTLEQVTLRAEHEGIHRGGVEWKMNGWANINKKSNSNAQHIHPGAYWSAVYYVSLGHEDSQDAVYGGDFQAFDPRGGLTSMYCPVLRIGLEGYMNAGGAFTHHPRAGQCLIFPSWLPHAVTPYVGEGNRISLAFNFSV